MEECVCDLKEARRAGKPDLYSEQLTRVLQDQRAQLFGGSLASSSDIYRRQAEERRHLLQRRVSFRFRLASTGNDMEQPEEVQLELRMACKAVADEGDAMEVPAEKPAAQEYWETTAKYVQQPEELAEMVRYSPRRGSRRRRPTARRIS
ncbi:unnamed protein product [Prorocentrum cordatum]|uniref:Uncharacterized protein n=1 Tax=Prorocentrum cordatum TaxID=2364126 RepID=A0ABN9T770_9DINO|nr:unnamed protein product [Polarella glacialis]